MKKEKGVTLVVLIITIIILIILAGISINMILGNNGIIEKAKKASADYENAEADEQNTISTLVTGMNKSITSQEETVTINKTEYEQLKAIVNSISNKSTSEQAIGKWVDGKTLYQTTYVGNTSNFSGNNWNVLFSIPDISNKTFVSVEGIYTNPDGNTIPINYNDNSTCYSEWQINKSSSQAFIYKVGSGTLLPTSTYIVTLQYTKN